MSFPGHTQPHNPITRHIQHLFTSTHGIELGLCRLDSFAIHHHNLTTSSRSRPTTSTSNHHASTGFPGRLFGDGYKSISSDSKHFQTTPSSQSEPTASSFPAKRILFRNPFPDDILIEAVRQHMGRKVAENDPTSSPAYVR
jgi:hypothetical protein